MSLCAGAEIRSTQFVLGLALVVAAMGCDQPGSGSKSGDVAEVTATHRRAMRNSAEIAALTTCSKRRTVCRVPVVRLHLFGRLS